MSIRTQRLVAMLGVTLAAATATAGPYAQLSSSENQAATTTAKVVTLNQNDALKDMENKNGVITFKQAGTYFVVAAGQIGVTPEAGKGTIKLWMRQNGKDIDNSNTEQTVAGSTSVLVCQGVGEFKAGDKLELVMSASAAGMGLVASKPKGEPAIPSMIFSAFQVSDEHFAQVSSSETQTAGSMGKAIALNSTDAAKGIENKGGTLVIKEAGTYFVMAAGQVGATTDGGKGTVKLWLRQNGKDVDNSNTEQSISGGSTAVLVSQGVGEFKAGDKIELMQSATGTGLGMVASKPKGEPAIPSMILSVFKVANKSYAQLSSATTQAATAEAKAIALASTDAAEGLQNAEGTLTVKEAGTYFVIAAGQVGATAEEGKGTVKLWLRQNGKDVDNSNAEQSVATSTSVLVAQGVGEFKAGDKLQLAQSATGTGVGMVASKPKGEPAIPSMILSIFKVD